MKRFILLAIIFFFAVSFTAAQEDNSKTLTFSVETAVNLSKLALKCIHKEYPNKMDHVMNDSSEVRSPMDLHPCFYGCFDWHSSVHGHWMLIRLLKTFPNMPNAQELRDALNHNITNENIQTEVSYLDQPNRKSFERTYGWAWLLKLAEELHNWDDADGKRWKEYLKPLAEALVKQYLEFLPKQTYSIRTGVHPNTAFGLAFALDYAKTTGNTELENLIIQRSKEYYINDEDCPAGWEPGGSDFFSPCLMEADLMRRVLPKGDFAKWFDQFMPKLTTNLLEPAIVADRHDPQIVHLDGLNLSRAWCMFGIANSLEDSAPIKKEMLNAAYKHAEDALKNIVSGGYEGEHWLGSFAVYMLSVK